MLSLVQIAQSAADLKLSAFCQHALVDIELAVVVREVAVLAGSAMPTQVITEGPAG